MNNKNKILIDCCYLNSPGGKTILFDILKKLQTNIYCDLFVIIIDSRNQDLVKSFKKITFKIISNDEYSRLIFYKKNRKNFHNVLCLSNVPPPVKLKAKVYIYFHNNILLSSKNLNLDIKTRLNFYLKKNYILWLNHSEYRWLVQSDLMRNNLSDKFRISKEKINVYPIFEDLRSSNTTKQDSFIYPSSNSKHKNNIRLIKAFIQSAVKLTHLSFNLKITINKTAEIDKVMLKAPKNLTVDFLGIISRDKVIDIVSKSKFLIFPSLTESFGLPLIEGCQLGCYVISSNLPYVNQVVKPTLTFDPYSVESISKIINQSVQDKNLIFTEVKAESATQLILNELTNV